MIEQNVKSANFGAVDLGSNAARFVVKNVEKQSDGRIISSVVMCIRIPVRLGEDVFIKEKVSEHKLKQLVQMFKGIKHFSKLCQVSYFRACGTSALREACNASAVVKKIEEKTDIHIDVISGREEANLLYANHEMSMSNEYNMFVDVGGGSTEISLLHNGQVIESRSFRIGTVRMLYDSVGPEVMDELREDVKALAVKYPGIKLIGSGGNIEKYYRMSEDRDTIKKTFSVKSLKNLYDSLDELTISERIELYGLKRDRADVIVPAGKIFLTVAESLNADTIQVPMYGLSDGIIADLIRQEWEIGK